MYTYQYYRDNPSIFESYKHKDLVPLTCSHCSTIYYRTKRNIRGSILYRGRESQYCSYACCGESTKTSVTEPCANCQNAVTRRLAERKSVKNVFCDSSCAASYNNKHKQYGIRRSKLEAFLEEELKKKYPALEIVANGKEAVGSELDLYFPQLRFAIELNGPTHYEPIYGNDKFEKIVANDKQKMIRCYEAGIELMVIDVSKVHHINEAKKAHYLGVVIGQLDSLMGRMVTPAGDAPAFSE